MSLLDSDRQAIQAYIKQRGLSGLLEGNLKDLEELSENVVPHSIKCKLARRFSKIVGAERLKRLQIEETRRIFNRFFKEWTVKMVSYAMEARETAGSTSLIPNMSLDRSIVTAELEQTLSRSREAELISKRVAFIPTRETLHPLVVVKDNQKRSTGVFKILSGQQMAGELLSYFLSLFCGVDYFHSVVPSYCWVEQEGRKVRKMGILSSFHEGFRTVFELYCSKSDGMRALERLPDEYVQGICLMHMLRGSEDAHTKNTLIQTTYDPYTQEVVVSKIIELDGEHVMSSSEPRSDRFEPHKDVASLRIWWLGLPQADKPLSNQMLELIQTWSRDKLLAFHAHLGLFPAAKVDAQMWRLNLMRQLTREALLQRKPLTAREIFAKLVYTHPTIAGLTELFKDPLTVYNSVGSISTDDLSSSSNEDQSGHPLAINS